MSESDDITQTLARARACVGNGEDEAAKAQYIGILGRDPSHFAALNELGALAYASGHRSAARSAYAQAVQCHPDEKVARVNLANLLIEDGELEAALAHYRVALDADPDFAPAHQGVARVLSELGDEAAAAPHWHKGFTGHAIVAKRYRGAGNGVAVLLLVSARGGNIPTEQWLDDRVFAVTALYADYHDATQPLPPHDVVLNAIGDADLCGPALVCAKEILARTKAPVVNPPALVEVTGRAANAKRLATIDGVIAPAIDVLSKSAILATDDLHFPFLLRAPGFHTGQHFYRVEDRDELAAAIAKLPGDELLAIQYLDARGVDGRARKYRVMIVDGVLYPLHLAISDDWKVHYFSAAMAADEAHRREEQRFLDDMPGVLGTLAMKGLGEIGRVLGLDYGGVDFGLGPDGSVLLFEANATMVINPPDPDPIWDYRRAAIVRVLDAARHMVSARATR